MVAAAGVVVHTVTVAVLVNEVQVDLPLTVQHGEITVVEVDTGQLVVAAPLQVLHVGS